jgi:energy-coupling factor transporter ATP-binding protein EcfA2
MTQRSNFEQTTMNVCAALTAALVAPQVLVAGHSGSGRSTLCEQVVANPAVRRRFGDQIDVTRGLDWWRGWVSSDQLFVRRSAGQRLLVVDDLDVALEQGGRNEDGGELVEALFDSSSQVAILATYAPDAERRIRRVFGPRLSQASRIWLAPPSADELARILQQHALLLEMCHAPYDQAVIELAASSDDDDLGHPRLGIERLDRWGARATLCGHQRVTLDALPPEDLPGRATAGGSLFDDEPSSIPTTPARAKAVPASECDFDRGAFIEEVDHLVIGQQAAISRIADLLDMSYRGLRLRGSQHRGAILLVGRSGIGKSSLAQAVADVLGGTLLRLDGSEFADDASRNCLIGAPPAYVGHNDFDSLPSRVNRIMESRDRTGPLVLLVDEIEKAHRDVQLLFLQAMEGRLTDSHGVVADFTDTIIIMSSNLTAARRSAGFTAASRGERQTLETLKKDLPPEFIGRFDLILELEPLSQEALRAIAHRELESMTQRLATNGYVLEVDTDVLDVIIDQGTDPALGARLLHRSIERTLLAPLARRSRGRYRATISSDGVSLEPADDAPRVDPLVLTSLTTRCAVPRPAT